MASTIKKSFAWTFVLSGAGFVSSFGTLIVTSYYFGASVDLDAYWVAFALMNMLAFPLAPLREALVPEFHRRLQQDPENASAYFSRAMTLILMVAVAGMLIGCLLARPLADLTVNGNLPQVRALAVIQLYWLAPALVLFAISETLSSMLTAYHQVVLQAIARLVGATSTLVVLGALAGVLHAQALPLGFIAAQMATSVVQLAALRRQGLSFRLAWPGKLGARFKVVSGALLVNYAASHAYAIFEKNIFTSFSTGLVSSFQYAVALTNVPITLLGITLSSVLWPRFLGHAALEDRRLLFDEVMLMTRVVLLLMGAMCALILLNASNVIELIYARGAFDAVTVTRTAGALRMAVFAAVPISAGFIMGRALISVGAAKSVMATGIATAVGGCLTLMAAAMRGSPDLATSHWLFANLAGLVVQAVLLVRVCGGARSVYIRGGWWLARWGVVLITAALPLQFVTVSQGGYAALISDIVLRTMVYVILFIALTWIFGLLRGIPSPFRR